MSYDPSSASEMIIMIRGAIAIKKQEIIQKSAEVSRLSAEIEDLCTRLAALQNQPPESEDA
jgi:hypothetical protein